jgi:hypothetical protein
MGGKRKRRPCFRKAAVVPSGEGTPFQAAPVFQAAFASCAAALAAETEAARNA